VSLAQIAAWYLVAVHHHSGQWSRGYALSCRLAASWTRRTGMDRPPLTAWEALLELEDHPVTVLYNRISEEYGRNL